MVYGSVVASYMSMAGVSASSRETSEVGILSRCGYVECLYQSLTFGMSHIQNVDLSISPPPQYENDIGCFDQPSQSPPACDIDDGVAAAMLAAPPQQPQLIDNVEVDPFIIDTLSKPRDRPFLLKIEKQCLKLLSTDKYVVSLGFVALGRFVG